MQAMLIKKLLMIAALLGVVQGVLTLLGGIIACFDKDGDVFFLRFHSKLVVDGLVQLMIIVRKVQIIVFQAMTLFN